MNFVDTHCHIHDSEFSAQFGKSPDELIKDAELRAVTKFICVGTDVKSSREAVAFCQNRDQCYASVALHPHEAADKNIAELKRDFEKVKKLAEQNVVAIGECGLDYFYHSDVETREKQKEVLHWHIELAQKHMLPLIFHIRDAFDDFLPIFDTFPNVKGVVHSFTAGNNVLHKLLDRGLYVGLNGIITFNKDEAQKNMAATVPATSLVFETDAPFLTPVPYRGKICEPRHVVDTAKFLASLREESIEQLAHQTTHNAKILFNLT